VLVQFVRGVLRQSPADRVDGGLLQFLELVAWGYIALAFYVVFEGCRDGLLHRIHRAREWEMPTPAEEPRVEIEPRPIRTEDL